jgi:hypothetical protein
MMKTMFGRGCDARRAASWAWLVVTIGDLHVSAKKRAAERDFAPI